MDGDFERMDNFAVLFSGVDADANSSISVVLG